MGTPVEVGEERKKESLLGNGAAERAELDGVGRERGELSERRSS